MLARWRELSRDSYKVEIETLLRSRQPLDEVVGAARRAIERAGAQLADDEVYVGNWAADLLAEEGVLLTGGYKSDIGEAVIEFIADDLRRQGISGVIDVVDLPQPPSIPDPVDLLTCRIRFTELDLLGRCVDWCLAGEAATSLQSYDGHAVALTPAQIRAALPMPDFTLSSLHSDGFRVLVLDTQYNRRLTLVEGGPRLSHGAWEPIVEGFAAILRRHARSIRYAHIQRGSLLSDSCSDNLVQEDWPPRPGAPWLHQLNDVDDRYVPDAFGLQLLGPGHADRVPGGANWRRVRLDADRTLLAHAEPERWFGARTVSFGGAWEQTPVPDFLAAARADLAPLLAR